MGFVIAILIVITIVVVFAAAYTMPRTALIVAGIACVILAGFYIYIELLVGIIAAPLIFIPLLVPIAISKNKDEPAQWAGTWARWILLSCIVGTLVAVPFVFSSAWGMFMFVILGALAGFGISYYSTWRYATTAYVISTIGSAMRQNLPLAMALDCAAESRSNVRSMILTRIRDWLVQGYSLSESIRFGYPKCPAYAVAMIAAAERINQLPEAIKSIELEMAAKADENKRIKTMGYLYPAVVIGVMFFIVLGLMTFVVPKFTDVLNDLTPLAELPFTTQLLVDMTRFVTGRIGPVTWLTLLALIFLAIPFIIRIRVRPRRPDKPYLISQLGDAIKWHLPILHWFENNYALVQVTGLLRLSLNSGGTVNEAIAGTLDLDVNNCFRNRIRKWLEKVEAGRDISLAAKQSGLGNSLSWAFDRKTNPDNTLSILDALESFYRSNYSYRVTLVRLMMGPCIVAMMGLMVGFVAHAMYSPLVLTIEILADAVP